MPAAELTVWIPGPPFAQPRGRAVRTPFGARVHNSPEATRWRHKAQGYMVQARQKAGWRHDGPVSAKIVAVFARPKRMPKALGEWMVGKATKPDVDNLAKAVLDAGNGVLWRDDGLVVDCLIEKRVAAEGAEEGVHVRVVAFSDLCWTGGHNGR